jgi:hypothetical protein
MLLNGSECPASKLVNSDACPRPTTDHQGKAGGGSDTDEDSRGGAGDAKRAEDSQGTGPSIFEVACVAALFCLGVVAVGLGRIVALYHLLIHVTPESLTYSVPLFLKRQCDRTLGADAGSGGGQEGESGCSESLQVSKPP